MFGPTVRTWLNQMSCLADLPLQRGARLGVAFGITLSVLACTATAQPAPPTSPPTPNFIKSVAISPQGFPADFSKFPDFCQEASVIPDAGIMWNGSWQDGVTPGQIPNAAAATIQCAGSNATPIIVFGWRSDATLLRSVPGNATNDWSNTEARGLYQKMVADFAATYKSAYIFLGNESDFYYQ